MPKPICRFVLAFMPLCLGAWGIPPVMAHPTPDSGYHRTIEVQIAADRVRVLYTLEVDQTLVVLDIPELCKPDELPQLTSKQACCAAFARCYGPIIADNLAVHLDGKALFLHCVKHACRETKEGHVVCDFVCEAPWQPDPGQTHSVRFREGNYQLLAGGRKEGTIDLALTAFPGVTLLEKTSPNAELKGRPFIDLRPGEKDRLYQASAQFTLPGYIPPTPEPKLAIAGPSASNGLADLLNSEHGFWMALLLAAGLGAAHAWTPGHGKTVAAAYLVGANGTVANALLLGLATTLSHTGGVILVAATLKYLLPFFTLAQVQAILGVGGGLLIAGLGFWLLMRRLAGQADHVHIGGGHHHHPGPTANGPGPWGVILLGISGGIVPCTDAIVLFLFAAFSGHLGLALPLLLAFSAGLAVVLVLIGIAIVYARGLAAGRWGDSRLFKALPLVSAVLITGMGLWLCYSSLQPPA
jgi:nickel/cobalt exporter